MHLKKLQIFSSFYFCGKSHFEDDSTQNYFVFQPTQRYFLKNDNTDHVFEWKSKGFPDENIKAPATSDNVLNLSLIFHVDCKVRV